jgi:hypothetical protein
MSAYMSARIPTIRTTARCAVSRDTCTDAEVFLKGIEQATTASPQFIIYKSPSTVRKLRRRTPWLWSASEPRRPRCRAKYRVVKNGIPTKSSNHNTYPSGTILKLRLCAVNWRFEQAYSNSEVIKLRCFNYRSYIALNEVIPKIEKPT